MMLESLDMPLKLTQPQIDQYLAHIHYISRDLLVLNRTSI